MNFLYVSAILGIVLGAWFLLPYGIRRLAERKLAWRCRDRQAIVLSYDDGPGSRLTPRLLDLLAESGAQANFFLLGRNAEANREMVPRLLAAGHEVGSHSFDHGNAWKISPWQAARDLSAGIRVLRILGGDPGIFRPPYGKATLLTLFQGWLRGQRFGWWTIDTKDTRPAEGRRSIDKILAEIERQGGGVVLMHDFDKAADGPEGDTHADYVLAMTTHIVAFAREKGYRLMRLSDVYKAEGTGND